MQGIKITLLVLVLAFLNKIICFDPITAGVAVGVTGALVSSKWVYCQFKECCNDKWTKFNASGLEKALNDNLFGQHLVLNAVPKAIKAHLDNDNPTKALVMSFHGWTGSGKNYVSDIIAQHVYKLGTKSKYVHKKIATFDYAHPEYLRAYQNDLKSFIEAETHSCSRSLFIFDEMDKMPEGLADVIKPFVEYHTHIKGIDYRKNIFIFLSNLGGDSINKVTLGHFNKGGKREDITAVMMEKVVSEKAFNRKGGFKSSDLILSGLIDHFIPFFPLERSHIKQCAAKEIKKRGFIPDAEILERIASELDYFPPPPDDGIFSSTGCKRVEKKVSLHL